MSAKDARAEAKAANARAKALRPWYKKKRTFLAALVVLIIIIIAASSAGSKDNNTPSAGGSTAATSPASTNPGLGDTAKDGNFAFVVHSMQCGVTQVGTSVIGETAPSGSQWCLVKMSVTNDKSTAQSFFAANQKAIDTSGSKLDADGTATIYMPNNAAADISNINPGVTVAVTIPFQLSLSDKITQVELHDSAFSGGVAVNI